MSTLYSPDDKRWLRIPSEERPKGHEKWTYHSTSKFLEARNRRLRAMASWVRLIQRLASSERFSQTAIPVRENTRKEPVYIEAIYGPLSGMPALTIAVREERDQPLDGANQKPLRLTRVIPKDVELPLVFTEVISQGSPTGPRYFIDALFRVIGAFGGHAHVKLRPSNKEFDVDSILFRRLVNDEGSIALLAGDLKLLEDRA